MTIPIRNLYYLLLYAWDVLEPSDLDKVSGTGPTSMPDLFALLLVEGVRKQLRYGLNRSYVPEPLEIAGVKGKLRLADSIKTGALFSGRSVCEVDDYQIDSVPNRIVKATLSVLITAQGLDKGLRSDLERLQFHFQAVTTVPVSRRMFQGLRFGGHDSTYKFLMGVCELVYEILIPDKTREGCRFTDFTRDEVKMARVFEKFLRRFYKVEQSDFESVGAERFGWKLLAEKAGDLDLLPELQTDITLRSADRIVIIEAKYYSQTLKAGFRGGKRVLDRAHLSQLHSYLLNIEASASVRLDGLLIYPLVDEPVHSVFRHERGEIAVHTVDLGAEWVGIRHQLLGFLAASRSELSLIG